MKSMISLSIMLLMCAPVNAAVLNGGVEVNDTRVSAQSQTLSPKMDASRLVEHCSCLNPNKVQVVQVDGQWQLVDGADRVANFGSQESAAYAARQVIKFYGFTQTCSVGRSDGENLHEMRYFKTGDDAPQGAMPNEDAISIEPSMVKAQLIQGTWKVTSGENWMLDFRDDRQAAEQASDIIRSYGFRYQCFVGSPGRLMMYFRK